jgi:hypothetical protein
VHPSPPGSALFFWYGLDQHSPYLSSFIHGLRSLSLLYPSSLVHTPTPRLAENQRRIHRGGQSRPWPPPQFCTPFYVYDYLVLSVEKKNQSFR